MSRHEFTYSKFFGIFWGYYFVLMSEDILNEESRIQMTSYSPPNQGQVSSWFGLRPWKMQFGEWGLLLYTIHLPLGFALEKKYSQKKGQLTNV